MGKNKSFLLKGVDPLKIDKLYGFGIVSNIDKPIEEKTECTKIDEIIDTEPEIFSFLDETQRSHKCYITMTDYLSREKLPAKTSISCFWDRNLFTTMPIGCPIKYIPSKLEKSYYSEITKDKYIILENISENVRKKIEEEKTQKKSLKIQINEHYETDGIFCSFNCVLAFIENEKRNPVYKDSKHLLMRMYSDIFGPEIPVFIKAPSWRLLSDYGGHLSITEFRKNFNRVEYKEIANIREFPKCKPIGVVFEEKLRL